MTSYQHTRIKQIVDCLEAIREDVCAMCQDWTDTAEHLGQPERVAADAFYFQSDINRNARKLYGLTNGIDLLAEIEQGEYSRVTMGAALERISVTQDKIDNWFSGVESTEDGPVNEYLRNDIDTIRDAIRTVQYHVDPFVYPMPAPISTAPATEQSPVATSTVPFFSATARDILHNTLSHYVEEPHRPALAELIGSGNPIDSPILHGLQQNVLAYVFTQLMIAKPPQITGTQTNVAKWICANFSPATYQTVYDVIRGKKAPTKDKRISVGL